MVRDGYNGIFTTDVAVLDGLVSRYPWFTSARLARAAVKGEADEMLALGLQTKPWPAVLVQGYETIFASSATRCVARPDTGKDDIIERFLASGEKRIVPDERTPLDDVSEGSSVFVPDEDMETGELERIYREQGLDRMADEVSDIVDESMEETY